MLVYFNRYLLFESGGVQSLPGDPGSGAPLRLQGIAFVVFDSGMAARRACGLSGEMFKAGVFFSDGIRWGPEKIAGP